MAWTPTEQIPDTRPLMENLLQFIRDNQTEAFSWANEGNPLKPFQIVFNNITGRVIDKYPSLAVVADRFRKDLTEDTHKTTWNLSIEVAIEGSKATDLVIESRKYEYALASMFLECANTKALIENSDNLATCVFEELNPVFDEFGENINSKYTQVCSLSAQFTFTSSAYV